MGVRMKKILEGKRVLITGGTGSLGKVLTRRLLSGEIGYRAWNSFSRWACRNSLKHATEVIAVSKTMALEAEKHTRVVRERPIQIVPYGVNPEFRPDTGTDRPLARPYILSVSSLLPHKNYEAYIKSFAQLKHRDSLEHDLAILGSGPAGYVQSLKGLAAKLQIEDSVRFVGYVENQSLPTWYTHADAFVLASGCESFGLPIIEAMASCTPVISSNQSGLPETVSSAGILADPGNIDAFAEQQYRVLTDPGLRETLRRRGVARAAEFSWERTAQATLDVMQKALS